MNSKLVYLFTLAGVAATQAHAVSLFNGTYTVNATISTKDSSAAEVSYDCKGSSRCGHLSVGQCDAAFRTINSGNTYATNGLVLYFLSSYVLIPYVSTEPQEILASVTETAVSSYKAVTAPFREAPWKTLITIFGPTAAGSAAASTKIMVVSSPSIS